MGTSGTLAYAESDSGRVVLHKELLNTGKMEATMRKNQDAGWLAKTTKGTGHLVTHELSHVTWNSRKAATSFAGLKGKQKAATAKMNKEIADLYGKFRKDWQAGKTPISTYATANINEFYAEGLTQGVMGTPTTRRNKYAKGLVAITRKYGIKNSVATKY
jgi:hypothetical protein